MKLTPEETKKIREEYLKTHRCINIECDQDGCLPLQVGDNEWEATQCEYCYKMRFESIDLIISRINTLLEEREKGLVEKIENAGFIEDNNFHEIITVDQAINIIKNQ